MVGPDLTGIAKKRSKAELLDSLLRPSAMIEPEFATHAVVTVDGAFVTGLLVAQNDHQLTLRSADGESHSIPLTDIEHQTRQATSLMPEGLVADMTAQELADLLAFLCELR